MENLIRPNETQMKHLKKSLLMAMKSLIYDVGMKSS